MPDNAPTATVGATEAAAAMPTAPDAVPTSTPSNATPAAPKQPVQATRLQPTPKLHKLALLFVGITFVLVTSGGLVTSYDAGMSVPDWPGSFGKFLILPVGIWSDMAVFLEHNHRLTGMVSGLTSIALLVGCGRVFGWKSKMTALAAVVLVAYVVQGIMGGFRVVLETWFGDNGVYEPARVLRVLHGITGQLVLGSVVWLTAALGPWFRKQKQLLADQPQNVRHQINRAGRVMIVVFGVLLLVQLALGATVRHYQAASAIPDAPFVYGGLVPPLDEKVRADKFEKLGGHEWTVYETEPAAKMEDVNDTESPDILVHTKKVPAQSPSTALVLVHYGHRLGAMVVLPLAMLLLLLTLAAGAESLAGIAAPIAWLVVAFGIQILLGMGVIFSREEPWVASAHQAVGALLMALTVWLLFRIQTARCVQANGSAPKLA